MIKKYKIVLFWYQTGKSHFNPSQKMNIHRQETKKAVCDNKKGGGKQKIDKRSIFDTNTAITHK